MEDYDDDYYVDSVGESHMKSHEDYIDEVEGRINFLKWEIRNNSVPTSKSTQSILSPQTFLTLILQIQKLFL